jgi:hypothetical protein
MPNQHSKNWGHIYLSTDRSTQDKWVQNTTMQNELVQNKSVHKGLVQNDEVMSIQQSKDWGQGYPTTDGSTPIEGVQNIAVQSELVQNDELVLNERIQNDELVQNELVQIEAVQNKQHNVQADNTAGSAIIEVGKVSGPGKYGSEKGLQAERRLMLAQLMMLTGC